MSPRQVIRLAALAGLALLVAGCDLAGWRTLPLQTRAGAPLCRLSDLRLVGGSFQGGAGTMIGGFSAVNTSSRECTVRGIPGVRLLTASGRPIPTHNRAGVVLAEFGVVRWPGWPVVALKPDQRAGIILIWSNECAGLAAHALDVRWLGSQRRVALNPINGFQPAPCFGPRHYPSFLDVSTFIPGS